MSLLPAIPVRIAQELNAKPEQIEAVITLLDEGATVPFIARYRKELHGALDDSQLRELQSRLNYLRELEERRATILNSIEEQDKLTPELKEQILLAATKTELEDLYLPYKPKRRTKGQIAIEAGLEPLADALYGNPALDPAQEALQFIDANKGVADIKAALEGARYILMERFAEDAQIVGRLRDYLWAHGKLQVKVVEGKEAEGAKFSDYFDYSEALNTIPSHRILAVLRGCKESILRYSIEVVDKEQSANPCEGMIATHYEIFHQGRPADDWLQEVVRWTWKVKLSLQLETDLITQLRQSAEEEAIKVFAGNMKDLLLAAPAGPRTTLGLDPGFRTGVKVVVIDATGKVLEHTAIYPHPPQQQWKQSQAVLVDLCRRHNVEIVSIGNGTASRETDKLVSEIVKAFPDLKLSKIVVSEAGASVYSASEFASKEFPDLDVTVRGAISIARRLQDPLAELVKIDPKSIGVGQYQHDVNQVKLSNSLDNVVEDCVNAVGVDVNTASAPLLNRVSGLNNKTANNIVSFREAKGILRSRKELLGVAGLGAKAFEQAAGFLRVKGDNPLDNSSVHPESYGIVESIARKNNRDVRSMIGDVKFLRSLNARDYVTEHAGELTIKDILLELEKPGRDPRPQFKTAEFKDGIETIADLTPGIILEGVVTNVTNFGAFVDIGVHQDGLVHISALSHEFVKDPRQVVKAGDIVKVKVMEVDAPRKRIGLSMRLDDDERDVAHREKSNDKIQNRKAMRKHGQKGSTVNRSTREQPQTAMGEALAKLLAGN